MIHVARVIPPPRFNYFVLILECNTSWGLIFSSDFLKWFLFFSTCDFFHHSLFIYTFFIFCQVRHDFFFFFFEFSTVISPPTTPFPLFSHVNITCHSHLYLKPRVKFWGISWWNAVSRVFQILLPCGPPVWSDTGERVLQGFFSCLNGLWLERRLVEKHSAVAVHVEPRRVPLEGQPKNLNA